MLNRDNTIRSFIIVKLLFTTAVLYLQGIVDVGWKLACFRRPLQRRDVLSPR